MTDKNKTLENKVEFEGIRRDLDVYMYRVPVNKEHEVTINDKGFEHKGEKVTARADSVEKIDKNVDGYNLYHIRGLKISLSEPANKLDGIQICMGSSYY